MAGRARFHALTELLERRTREEFEPEPDDPVQPTTLDYVCHWLSSGKTAKSLAQSLDAELPFPLDYAGLMRYLKAVYGEKAEPAIDEARTLASFALTEEALDIVDAPAETSAEVARAASRARSRQWMAERYNQSRFGQQKAAITVNVGTLHLDALRARPVLASVSAAQTIGDGDSDQAERGRDGSSQSVGSLAPARLIVSHNDTGACVDSTQVGIAECESGRSDAA